MKFEKDIKIEKNALDYEWERQPSLVAVWQKRYADSIYERDRVKEQMELVYAEVEFLVREGPEKFGIKKVTEGSIRSAVLQSKRYKEATKKFHEIKRDSEILAVARNALEHKKKALEYLTQLYIAGYWSEPRIKKEAKEVISEKSTKAQEKKLGKNPRLQKRSKAKK